MSIYDHRNRTRLTLNIVEKDSSNICVKCKIGTLIHQAMAGLVSKNLHQVT